MTLLKIAIAVLCIVCIVLTWRTECLKRRLDMCEAVLEKENAPLDEE